MAVIDFQAYVAELKEHLSDHQFHIHDERHFVETYSMRQAWEIDVHPELACGGPLDLRLTIELDPRAVISFEDHLMHMTEMLMDEPESGLTVPLAFCWTLPPLKASPDLLVLTTDLAGLGGTELPLQVSSIDSTAEVTDAADHTIAVTSNLDLSLDDLFMHRDSMCEAFDRAYQVSEYLVEQSLAWIGDD